MAQEVDARLEGDGVRVGRGAEGLEVLYMGGGEKRRRDELVRRREGELLLA